MGNSFGKQTHSSTDPIEHLYCTDEDPKKSFSQNKVTNSSLDQRQKDHVDKEGKTRSNRTKSSSGSLFSGSKFDKKTVAPAPAKKERPSSADLLKVSTDEKRTAAFYDNGENDSRSSSYSEDEATTVPQSRQKLEIQIQAMTDEVERLWTILTQQHLTHITPDQSASKCPIGFMEHIHDIEIYADDLKRKIDAIQREKNTYINRLSNVAGSLLTDNNPNITDLNDPNRPVKLAEKLAKIYDDEWTDAVQDLEKKKSKKKEKKHEKIVYHLYSLIKVLYTTCKKKAEEQVGHFLLLKDPSQYQVEASWSEIPVESRKSFTEDRKKIAVANIEMLQKIIKDDDIYKKEISSLSLDDKILEYLQNSTYFKKCLEICWYFVIQDPPLYLDISPLEGNLLDKDTHKEYTKSGSTIKYAVWPALYLHFKDNEKGPLLAKGVVQPKARKHIDTISEEDLLHNH
ncbi:uncharacterized protein LOC143085126 isoform X2 [Mytilus galloprovincialis]|uniref:uncharacterized protein LOC143085126 isoform X2 n=1 Tax=Mytilus galloprovincialis TaxID=29158 RepID=UPI003F7CB50A